MATYKELKEDVEFLNNKFCKNSKNELIVRRAYGGYRVELTGKQDKRYKKKYKTLKGSIGTGSTEVTRGFDTASKTKTELWEKARSGAIKRKVSYWEKQGRK